MALRIDKVETLSVGKSKDMPVGFRRCILCNSGSGTVYFRPADGKKTTQANGFPLYAGEKTAVLTAESIGFAAEGEKGEVKILWVKEE